MKWILSLGLLFLASTADAQIFRGRGCSSGACNVSVQVAPQAACAPAAAVQVAACAAGETRVRVRIFHRIFRGRLRGGC